MVLEMLSNPYRTVNAEKYHHVKPSGNSLIGNGFDFQNNNTVITLCGAGRLGLSAGLNFNRDTDNIYIIYT